MKAAPFDYLRPADLGGAIAALAAAGARVLAGGQSLGAMLNLRLARPALLIDVGRLAELRRIDARPDGVLFGAAFTHAEFEDAAVPDPTGGVLGPVAQGIAYRAVRNRGTIGGSLAHADPAADWPTALAALGASVRIAGPAGERQVAVEDFIVGPFATILAAQEILTGVFVPRLSASRRWGFAKSCRKVGEFAESMAAVLSDPGRDLHRIVVGALEARPVVIPTTARAIGSPEDIDALLKAAGLTGDGLHRAMVRRAIAALDARGTGA